MKYRRSGSKRSIAMPRDPIYHAATDVEQEILYGSLYPSQRYYIDPWDLENYDYVRKQLSSSPTDLSTPSPAGEPISSAFYYMSQNSPGDCTACYAGLDEQTFYNAKYETILDDDENLYNPYTEFESGSSPEGRSSCGESAMSAALMLHTPGFGVSSGRRRLVLPKPAPQLEFPAPPPYDYCVPMSENNYCSLSECYDCLSESIPLYASSTYRTGRSPMYKPHRFGLSKNGLLQIDYSCNWNDLDRYIAKEM